MRGIVWDGSRLHVTDELTVRSPGPGEVQVRVLASGICHSDLNVMDYPGLPLPAVLGHEAAGIVERLGEGVSHVKVGDPIVVGTQTPCGHCRECDSGRYVDCGDAFDFGENQPFSWRGQPVQAFASVGSFAGLITVKAQQVVAAEGIVATSAALIGCAVSTGYGAVRNIAAMRRGDVVVVFGVGGIGVNAIQTAHLDGAAMIVAVDINPDKEALARHFGADKVVIAPRGIDGAALAQLVAASAVLPVDVAIECSGANVAIDAAIRLPKRGGASVLVGMPAPGSVASFDTLSFTMGRRILAGLNGGINPHRDYADIIGLVRHGKLDVDTRIWPLAEVDDAIAALRSGQVTRAVLDHLLL